MRSTLLALAAAASAPAAAAAQGVRLPVPAAPRLTDAELAQVTGKFVLPNGVELALTVTSDTVVNGQLVLRTVFTVDHGSRLQIFGRDGQGGELPYAVSSVSGGAAPRTSSGASIAVDRVAGLTTLTPTFAASPATSVTVGAVAQGAVPAGLVSVPVVSGGPALATADGTVAVRSLGGGSQVTFTGDRLAVANLVGPSIATAVVNSASNRTLDSVTTITIDARNLAPYQVGAAQMRVDSLVTNVARGMGR